MKRATLFLIPLLLLTGCSGDEQPSSSDPGNTEPANKLVVYLDYSEASTSEYRVKVNSASATGTSNYSFSLSLSIKNLTSQTQEISFSNTTLIRESTGASYTVSSGYSDKLTLDSEIEGNVSFTSTIPSSLEEKYYFSVDFKDINYKVYLYETPDDLREDVTVTYKLEYSTVHTETLKKGRSVGTNYVYDATSHQSYADTWKDTNGVTFTQNTRVEEDMVVTGQAKSNLQLLTTSSDVYMFVNGINHVHADGKVVVLERYQNKEVCLGNYAIYNNPNVKEVYLPVTLHHIYNSNFSNCGNLQTIYFAGTQEQWDAIPKDFVTIPTSVNVVFNTSFEY